MSTADRTVEQLSEEIGVVPEDPPLHEAFRELDVVPDTEFYEDGDRHTAFVDPNDLTKHIAVSHDVPVDLQEVQ